MDFMVIVEDWDLFASGLWYTAHLTFLALVIGGLLSIPLAIARYERIPVLSQIIYGYVYLFRGTPLLIQLYLIYYGLGDFEFVRESFLWPMLREAWWCTLIAFVLNTAAYTTEIFRGAIEATPYGEVQAAKACGMSYWQRMRRIILPSSFRRSLPAYSNEVIFMLHGSVVASLVTIQDILGVGRTINAKYYIVFEGLIAAAILYMILVYLISKGFKLWEKKWHAHLRPRESAAKTDKPGGPDPVIVTR
ncbi:MAG: ABC transporter permease [Alphaproteobacteria bacterium]